MNFQHILNNHHDIVGAQCWPNIRVGPKVVGRPELPVLPLPPVKRAFPGGQGEVAKASMDADILGLAREALSKRLEDYQLEAVLGKGAFGCVYRAKDLSARGHGKKVAIKQIPRAKVGGGSREMLFLEKRILSRLTMTDSPYFTPLIESFMDPHNFIIVQGFAAGGSLRDAMDNARKLFRMHEIQFIMAQLCHAVCIMQDNGVVHRDLKPDNVFLDENGRLVIGDFGLGHLFDTTQGNRPNVKARDDFWDRTSGFCGTPGYMAPEVVRDDHYSFKIDNFTIGVMFYELVFGRLPFRGRDRKGLEARTLYGSAFIPRWFRKQYRAAFDLMRRLLAKNADHRISMRDAMKSRYFKGVNWDQVAAKMQPVPAKWKTSPKYVRHGARLSKRVLIEDPYALQRWRPDPAEYEFLAPLRFRPGKEFPSYMSPIFMPPPAISPDLREERLAVGLMVKQIVERGVQDRQPQVFVTVPLNEPIPSPQVPDSKQDSNDVEMISLGRDRFAPPPAYDTPHPITDDMQEDDLGRGEAGGHSLFSAQVQSPASEDPRRTEQVPQAQDDMDTLFNESIVAVEEYLPETVEPSLLRRPQSYPKLFLSYGDASSELLRSPPRITQISIPPETYTTLAYPDSPEPVTPHRSPSNGGLTKPLDFPTLCKALEVPDTMQQGAAVRKSASRPLPTPPTLFVTQDFDQTTRFLSASKNLIDLYGVPMDLSD